MPCFLAEISFCNKACKVKPVAEEINWQDHNMIDFTPDINLPDQSSLCLFNCVCEHSGICNILNNIETGIVNNGSVK